MDHGTSNEKSLKLDREDSVDDGGTTTIKSQIVKVNNQPQVENSISARKTSEMEEQKAKRLKVVRKVAVKQTGVAGQDGNRIPKDRKSLEIYKPPGTSKFCTSNSGIFPSINQK